MKVTWMNNVRNTIINMEDECKKWKEQHAHQEQSKRRLLIKQRAVTRFDF